MIDRILSDPTALAHAEAEEWSQCAARLNATAVPVPDRTLRGSGWLMTALPSDAEAILKGFSDAYAASAAPGPLAEFRYRIGRTNALLDTSGIDWSTDALQSLLPVVAAIAGWSPELLGRVQSIGLPRTVVDSSQVEAEWRQHLIDSALSSVIGRTNAVKAAAAAAHDAPGATADSIASAAQAAWEA